MRRRIALPLFAAVALSVAGTVLSAAAPTGILCEKEIKGKPWIEIYEYKQPGNMGDAVQRCIADGGHPVGPYFGGKGGK